MKNSIILFLILISNAVHAQEVTTPLREFRAAWIATVGNIDWPSKKGLSSDIQQQEFIQIIDQIKQNGLNAVIVQIRPAADALYNSPYENWSRYLSGTQGTPPYPYYDPLTFMVEECHKRCIEFHAWFNPFRALVDVTKNPNTSDHVTYTHPDWFLNYGDKKYFDPGLPEVREYFMKIVMDVVKRYDIDAVHFDDYFYPYRIAKQEFPDYRSYARYGLNFSSKDDWRRDNVNKLIEALSKKIKAEKPYVKFGISPFGVWRNSNKDPEGSFTTAGQTNYDDLFADVLLWQKKGWIDYILPQLYWENGHRAADYAELIRWWSAHSFNRHLYIGHGLYQVGVSKKVCWRNMNEIETQIQQVRSTKNVQGSAYYSANAFKKNLCNLNFTFQSDLNPKPALLPLMSWIDNTAPESPVLKLSRSTSNGNELTWTIENKSKEPLQFAVYKFLKNEQIDLSQSKNLCTIIREQKFSCEPQHGTRYKYVVCALDRLHNQSLPSNSVE